MSEEKRREEHDLIGHCLGLLDEAERRRVSEALRVSPALQREEATVNAVLRRLDACTVDEASPDLAERAIAACAGTMPLRVHRRVEAAGHGLSSGEDAPQRDGPMISLKELLSLAAAVALFVALYSPAYQRSKLAAMQAACLDQFRSLGQAQAGYATANAGMLPFAGGPATPWLATPGNQPVNSNSRHAYLLLLHGYVDNAGRFICPARPADKAMPADEIRRHIDFPSLANNSYSAQLLNSAMRVDRIEPATPLMADQNPRFESRRYRPRDESNSDSHGYAAGQNVLRSDGAAAWTNRAEMGPARDDIFKLADLSTYTGYERPQSSTDAFLVP